MARPAAVGPRRPEGYRRLREIAEARSVMSRCVRQLVDEAAVDPALPRTSARLCEQGAGLGTVSHAKWVVA